ARECRSEVRVERDTAQRVDEAQAVGACRLDRADGLAELPGMWRKLGVEPFLAHFAARREDLRRPFRRLVDIRAREVQLDRGNVVSIELLARLGVVADREAPD